MITPHSPKICVAADASPSRSAMEIRKAEYTDIEQLMQVFEGAKRIMRESGNLHQWTDGYPSMDVVRNDIDSGNCYVLCEGGRITGTMALIPGPDPTYARIEGDWMNDEPYFVIHRIATSAPGRRTARLMFDWAFAHISKQGCKVIRIDTHKDNCIMKHILEKYGFTMCGVIYLADGAPRDAYIL